MNSRMKPLVLKVWKDFSNGWTDAFGGRDVRPLKKKPNAYLTQYLKQISKNPKETENGKEGASRWLLNKYEDERRV